MRLPWNVGISRHGIGLGSTNRQATIAASGQVKGAAEKAAKPSGPSLPKGRPAAPSEQQQTVSMASHAIDVAGRFHETGAPPSASVLASLHAKTSLWSKPPRRQAPRPMRRFDTLAALLRTCPNEDEMARIRTDFNIYFDQRTAQPWTCTEGGTESSAMLTVYNIFRFMYSLDFDAPMPIIGATNLYEWLRSLNISYHFRWPTPDDGYNWGDGDLVTINSDGMAAPYLRTAWMPESGSGLWSFASILLHEAHHTDPGGAARHVRCGPDAVGVLGHDPTLAYGGSYGLGYWYMMWLADHLPVAEDPDRSPLLGPARFLPDAAIASARATAQYMRGADGAFCDERDAAMRSTISA
jgi:hypothetical protein